MSRASDDARCGNASSHSDISPRRGFFKAATVLISAAVGAIPLWPGLRMLLHPLRSRSAGAAGTPDGMIRVTNLSALPADGIPRQFPILADERDAWTRTAKQRVGSVFLRRRPDSDELQCFSSICPHAGCSVQFSQERQSYVCPCHNSEFSLDGAMIPPTPSPRDLDPLEVRSAEDGSVLVKFVRYYPGNEERKVKS